MLKSKLFFILAAVTMLVFSAVLLSAQGRGGSASSSVKCAHCGREIRSDANAKVENGAGKLVDLCFGCRMLPKCEYCQMPAEEKTAGDNRLCRECARDTITDKAEAEKVMKDVRQVLTTKFKMTTRHKIDYEIGTRKDLNLEADGEHLELGWFDPKMLRGKPHYTIRILTGLPRYVFRSVAAHELAHDWMDETLPYLMDKPEIREGFAEFVAWSFSSAEGNKRMMHYTEGRTDEVYGDGFRKVKKMMGAAKTAAEWKAVLQKEFPQKQSKKGGK